MLRLSANISTLFTELPMLDRPAAAATAGFRAIELQFPYGIPSRELAAACRDAHVACVLINCPAGEPGRGELGLAGLPECQREFAESIDLAMNYARELGCPRVNCLAGRRPAGATRAHCWEVLVDNLRSVAGRLADVGVRLLVEPLNEIDVPGFLLATIRDADALLSAVDHPNVALQYDVYHRRAAGDDWLAGLRERIARIGHIQFSDYPGRHQPGTGEMDFARLFAQIRSSAYPGWTGCEYWPTGPTLDSFGWRALLPD